MHTIMVHSVPQEANSLWLNMNHVLGYAVWLWGVEIIPVIDSMWSYHRSQRKRVQGCLTCSERVSLPSGGGHMVKLSFFIFRFLLRNFVIFLKMRFEKKKKKKLQQN